MYYIRYSLSCCFFFFFQAEDGIRDAQESRGLGDVYKRQIVEDGHQFWRTYYKFNGYHEVVPMYTPIYMDAVLGDTLGETIKEQYLQKKRWSWGVSAVSYTHLTLPTIYSV